jgi:hypothetical protein
MSESAPMAIKLDDPSVKEHQGTFSIPLHLSIFYLALDRRVPCSVYVRAVCRVCRVMCVSCVVPCVPSWREERGSVPISRFFSNSPTTHENWKSV